LRRPVAAAAPAVDHCSPDAPADPLINWTDISVGIEEFQEKAGLWPGGDAPKE
jgi:hypothetical protein